MMYRECFKIHNESKNLELIQAVIDLMRDGSYFGTHSSRLVFRKKTTVKKYNHPIFYYDILSYTKRVQETDCFLVG